MSTQQRTLSAADRPARISARVDPEILDHIAARARRADVQTSHMIRRMLAYADRHMPTDWTPSEPAPGDDEPAMLAGPPPGQFGPPPGQFGPPPGRPLGPPPGARQGKARRAS
jgi:hypothetical protein